MAETLTMEPNVEKTSIENLSAEEQDSLKVGEQMQEAQDNLLAGKYKNAEELEKGYLELQQKLNTKQEEPAQEEVEEEESTAEEAEANILDQLWEEAGTEEGYSQESLDKLRKMSVDELAQMHLEYRDSVTKEQPQDKDFSEADIKELKGIVGGEENYTNMIQWAQGSLNEQEIQMSTE